MNDPQFRSIAEAAAEAPRLRYWLTFTVGSFRIKAETNRAAYRAAHAATFPHLYGPDFDPPDDEHWWSDRPLCDAVTGHRPDGHWGVLLPPVRQRRGGWIEEVL